MPGQFDFAQSASPLKPRRRRSPWGWIVAGVAVVGLVVAAGIGVAVVVTRALAPTPEVLKDRTSSLGTTPSNTTTKNPAKRPSQDQSEKDAFLEIVRKNAEDPSDLEIVVWGEQKQFGRSVRFRCKLVGIAARGNRGAPVMIEDAQITYDAERSGKIKSVYLEKCYRYWYP